MIKKTPKVSVLTPIYNTNPVHLKTMIESVLNQSFTDFEFLILNDSPDNKRIKKIVLHYAKLDKRIKYTENKTNMGISYSRNKLIKMSKGKYLAIFDHDDISKQNRLEKEVCYLDNHPYIGVVSGWLQYFGENHKLHKTPEQDTDIKIWLTEDCYIAHTAAMIRKSVLTKNNIEYEEYYSPAEDYRLWARLMDVTHFYNFQEVLVYYRWSINNTTNKQAQQMAFAHDCVQLEICDKHPFMRKLCISERYRGISTTKFRLRLFNFIPLLKIKNNKVYLFECLPIFKIKLF